jgi:hypothetical protein
MYILRKYNFHTKKSTVIVYYKICLFMFFRERINVYSKSDMKNIQGVDKKVT